jgi:hypothetical protein
MRESPRLPLSFPRASGRERPGFGNALASNSAILLEKEWNEKVNIPLRKIMEHFKGSCISCFFGSKPDLYRHHRTEHCPVSNNLMGFAPGYGAFRKKFNVPIGCCYGCGLTTKVNFNNFYHKSTNIAI